MTFDEFRYYSGRFYRNWIRQAAVWMMDHSAKNDAFFFAAGTVCLIAWVFSFHLAFPDFPHSFAAVERSRPAAEAPRPVNPTAGIRQLRTGGLQLFVHGADPGSVTVKEDGKAVQLQCNAGKYDTTCAIPQARAVWAVAWTYDGKPHSQEFTVQ